MGAGASSDSYTRRSVAYRLPPPDIQRILIDRLVNAAMARGTRRDADSCLRQRSGMSPESEEYERMWARERAA